MCAYLYYVKPKKPEFAADEMLAIKCEIETWREKKESEEANARYNEYLIVSEIIYFAYYKYNPVLSDRIHSSLLQRYTGNPYLRHKYHEQKYLSAHVLATTGHDYQSL